MKTETQGKTISAEQIALGEELEKATTAKTKAATLHKGRIAKLLSRLPLVAAAVFAASLKALADNGTRPAWLNSDKTEAEDGGNVVATGFRLTAEQEVELQDAIEARAVYEASPEGQKEAKSLVKRGTVSSFRINPDADIKIKRGGKEVKIKGTTFSVRGYIS